MGVRLASRVAPAAVVKLTTSISPGLRVWMAFWAGHPHPTGATMSDEVTIEVSPDHFAATAQDISHVTFYFDTTPDDGEDDAFFFVKIETTDAVDDDLDHWYQAALDQIIARNPGLADAEVEGVAIKYGKEEDFFRLDNNPNDHDTAPTGHLVQGHEYKHYEGGVTYSYDELF